MWKRHFLEYEPPNPLGPDVAGHTLVHLVARAKLCLRGVPAAPDVIRASTLREYLLLPPVGKISQDEVRAAVVKRSVMYGDA